MWRLLDSLGLSPVSSEVRCDGSLILLDSSPFSIPLSSPLSPLSLKTTEKRWPKSSSRFQLATRSLLASRKFRKFFRPSRFTYSIKKLKPCNSPQSSVWSVFTRHQVYSYFDLILKSRFCKLSHVYWRSRRSIISETYLVGDKFAPIIGVEFWLQYFIRYYIK